MGREGARPAEDPISLLHSAPEHGKKEAHVGMLESHYQIAALAAPTTLLRCRRRTPLAARTMLLRNAVRVGSVCRGGTSQFADLQSD